MLRHCSAILLVAALWPALLSAQPPLPAWAELRDLGLADPRLTGLKAPGAIKVELVAQPPALSQLRQLAFGEDGTLYVLTAARVGGGKPELLSLTDANRGSEY